MIGVNRTWTNLWMINGFCSVLYTSRYTLYVLEGRHHSHTIHFKSKESKHKEMEQFFAQVFRNTLYVVLLHPPWYFKPPGLPRWLVEKPVNHEKLFVGSYNHSSRSYIFFLRVQPEAVLACTNRECLKIHRFFGDHLRTRSPREFNSTLYTITFA